MRRSFLVALLLLAGLVYAGWQSDFLAQFSTPRTVQQCVSTVLEHGDKDHDGTLSEAEWVDVTLISFDYAQEMTRKNLADLPGKRAPAKAAELRAQFTQQLARGAKKRPAYVDQARQRFAGWDTNHDGRLDHREQLAACYEQENGKGR